MAELLRCVDAWGRTVTLSDAQWHGHIIVAHPEVRALLGRLREALESPTTVTHDTNHADRENFYTAARGPLLLKVCVEYVYGKMTGAIVTAYLTNRVKPTERVQWPTSIQGSN